MRAWSLSRLAWAAGRKMPVKAWEGLRRPSAAVQKVAVAACQVRQRAAVPSPVLPAAGMFPAEEAEIAEALRLPAPSFLQPGPRRPALPPAEALPGERAVLPVLLAVPQQDLKEASGASRQILSAEKSPGEHLQAYLPMVNLEAVRPAEPDPAAYPQAAQLPGPSPARCPLAVFLEPASLFPQLVPVLTEAPVVMQPAAAFLLPALPVRS